MKKLLLATLLMGSVTLGAQTSTSKITIHADQGKNVINKEIYGQFAEHLGTCIYGGIWVGENSPIPNTKGYRNDVLNALKQLHIPVLRWPGGCFADEYHWMDGIGPKEKRAKIVNNNWGGVVEDNSFGTNEFFNLCELLDTEPYLSGNVGSGSVEELAKWVEYITSAGDSPMARLRRQNGRENPWKLKYLGVGNESWGCGGNMTPDYYSDLYRRYSTYCREYDGNKLFKIASGASDYDYKWTETLMKNVGDRMNGVSLHYYTVKGWNGSKGSATKFNKDEYLWTMDKCLEIEDVVKKHIAIMDKYDPTNKVGLMVDEWGTWWDQEPGSTSALYQQNSMRDAFVAALSLNIFNKYTERVKMTNIAQVVNVLQAMILTDGPKMVLTPTYHVFDMYKVHMGATYLPIDIQCDSLSSNDKKFASVSVSASKDAKGLIHVTLANVDPDKEQKIEIDLGNAKISKVSGTILTAKTIDSYNTFENPNVVTPAVFKGAKVSKKGLSITVPAKAIISLELL
ncbi:MAG TPA: alpha-L-arabinofuranosidase C-terminal domain-containing protein [Paludibacter sp.]|nr:alpha-L-arabinofuranosidase C-terminal domain-containing protein [Paludibacter sp.]